MTIMKISTSSDLINLDHKTAKRIASLIPPSLFQIESNLFYKGQIPNLIFLLIRGEIKLLFKNNVELLVRPRQILGAKELLMLRPTSYDAIALPGSQISMIDRSSFIDIVSQSNLRVFRHLEADIPEILVLKT